MAAQSIGRNSLQPQKLESNPVAADVEELMGNVPIWIVRWGITLVFFIISAFIFASWLVRYPDIIKAEVMLTTQNPPIRVIALSSGKISQLLVTDKQRVDSGEVLAVLENTASWADVSILEAWLKASRANDTFSLSPPIGLQMGNIQNTYARLLQEYAAYQYFVNKNGLSDKLANLQRQIHYLEDLKINYGHQKINLAYEREQVQKDYNRNQILLKEGVISKSDFDKQEIAITQAKRQIQLMDAQIINVDIQSRQLSGQVLDLSYSKNNNQTDKKLNLDNTLHSLAAEIQKWKQDYLLIAPISGSVSFSKIWSPLQFVKLEDEVMTIAPNRDNAAANQIICRAILTVDGIGKVKPNQEVNIRLAAYPYQEFGTLPATVVQIAAVPTTEGYPIEMAFKNFDKSSTDTLRTNSHKKIAFRQEMKGVAHIITENRSIMSRIFDKLYGLIKK